MKNWILLSVCFFSISLFAQKKEADAKFGLYQYSEAIPLYKRYLEKHPKDYQGVKNLALSCKYTNNISCAIANYNTLLQLPEAVAEDWYDMVQLLRISGDLAGAKVYALQYEVKNGGEKAANLLKSIEMYDELVADRDKYDVVNKTAQYAQSVFAPGFYRDALIVTAEFDESGKNDWTGRGYTKLFITDLNFTKLLPFAGEVMTGYSDGPASLSEDGKMMYYTTVNKNTLQEQDVNTRKLQISSAILKEGRWEPADLFNFKNNSCNVAHPQLSKDGKMLVFSSDMPGGKGKMDLYYCLLQTDNIWSTPVNVAILNTSENEIFPTFDEEGNLYFASNGLPGLGGLDAFVSKRDNQTFGVPVNLKAPINSIFDDFSLITSAGMENGYISTNRFESAETDDVAFFSRRVEKAKPAVKILVLDKYTSIPLPYALVTVKDEANNVVYTGMTDTGGVVFVEDLVAGNYRVQGILNEITTTVETLSKNDFAKSLIEKVVTHNDPRFTLTGVTINTIGGPPVPGVMVTCENLSLNKKSTAVTGADGKFFFQLEQGSDFKIYGSKEKWLSSEVIYESTKGLDRSKDLFVKIKLSMQQPTAKDVIRLDKIFYDYDKCNIKARAGEELNRLIRLMYDYPEMIIELSSHTDSRGSNTYNRELSQCRADSAVNYILRSGILSTRIVARGYGESQIVNECTDGIECSEKKHQENRRTEFRIISCPDCPEIRD